MAAQGETPESLSLPPRSGPSVVQQKTTLAQALNVPGDLTLRNSTLSGALNAIAELWSINIVYSQIDGNVNGVFKKAPLREILDSILLSNGYGYRAVGESLVVSNLSQLGQVNPFFESATITVTTANIADIVASAQLQTTPQGKVQAIPSANSIFVLDFPDRVQKIREFVLSLDAAARGETAAAAGPALGPRRLEVAYMKSHYVSATTASTVLQSVLSPQGKVTAMESEDRLLVVDYAENLDVAQRVLERIDRPRPQVSIRSLIYDLSLTDVEELGINWTSLTNGSLDGASIASGVSPLANATLDQGAGTLINSVTTTPLTTGGTFTLFNLGSSVNLAAVAQLLQSSEDSRLLASPNITVAENEQAVIQSVSEIPFQQLTQTNGGGNIGTTAFKEAGITLQVQPKIARDLTVEMVVRPEFSLLTGFTPGDNQPIIDRRTAETTVRVANGHTLVLGGMRQRSDVGSFNGIPFLKDVRLIGNLFRSRSTNIRESELVVFITPTVVGFDTPASSRNQQTIETAIRQLDRVPPAASNRGAAYSIADQKGSIEGIGPQYPSGGGVESLSPAPQPTSQRPPLPGDLKQATLTGSPRRLPLPQGETTPQLESQDDRAEVATRLRPGFNERFQDRSRLLR